MTSEELKNLVKSHFSLVEATEVKETTETVEEAFGEIADENKAFVIKFPGDSLQVGDKVTVKTAEGQELDAPDGEHRLEDGTEIVTKDSVVTEIKGADGEKELSEEFDARTDAEEEGYLDGIKDEKADEKAAMEEEVEVEVEAAKFEEIIKAIVDEVKDEMGKMKTKMEALEDKVSSMSAFEAAEPTLPSAGKKVATTQRGFNAFNVEESLNADRIKMALKELKNKK